MSDRLLERVVPRAAAAAVTCTRRSQPCCRTFGARVVRGWQMWDELHGTYCYCEPTGADC
ncbi:hypothetical protein WEH80_24875 [Actinomycetes bacterium KLBMP 9759]